MARPDLQTAIQRRIERDASRPRTESPMASNFRAQYADLDARVRLVEEQPELLAAMPAHERAAVLTRAEALANRTRTGAHR